MNDRKRERHPSVLSASDRQGTMFDMGDGERWTAEELEKLSPEERIEIVRAGIVTNVDQVPPAFLERVRENVRDHIASTESAATTER